MSKKSIVSNETVKLKGEIMTIQNIQGKKSSDYLKEAKALIQDPTKWIQGSMAKNAQGEAVGGVKEGACQFCAIGAIWFVTPGLNYGAEERKAIRYMRAACHAKDPNEDDNDKIIMFNDHPKTTHADVMKKFDKAIQLALQSGD